MSEVGYIKDLLANPAYISIITHRNPDGDAVGSMLALNHLLKKLGHTVRMIAPSEYPAVYEWMPEIDQIKIFDVHTEECKSYFSLSHVIICLDFNSLDRIDHAAAPILDSRADKVLIDHHVDPEPFADYVISDTGASSTCELVYKFMIECGWKDMIDMRIAEAIYTGIVTDTGSFKYNTNPSTFEIIAELKKLGLDDFNIQDRIFNSLTEKQMRLLGHCIANRMEILEEFGAGIIALTREDYLKFDIQRGDTEGIVNYILMIKGMKLAAFITAQPKLVKLSLRSKGDISVQEIARNEFNGGGHKNASGGYMYKPLDVVVNRFKEALIKYVNK
jgi:phosphoesterase RecJ-like protein